MRGLRLGLKAWGLMFCILGLGLVFCGLGLGILVWGFGFGSGFGIWDLGLGFGVWGSGQGDGGDLWSGFWFWFLRFGVQALGLRLEASGCIYIGRKHRCWFAEHAGGKERPQWLPLIRDPEHPDPTPTHTE